MNKTIKNIGCSILAGVMGCSLVNFPLFAAEEDQPSTKTETVYTVLNEDGTVQDSIVSSWLHDDDGINHISETLDLDDVENIKGDEKPVVNGKEYTWNVKGNDVYYQGKTTKKLPLSISIQYKLDGKPVTAKELEGKSGKLEMTITFKNNIDKVIDANGKKVTIHPSYLAGGMIDLDTDIYSDVQCRQGKIVNDGKNEMLAFATIPGLAQTLDEAGLNTVTKKMDLSDSIVITANVKDYKETEIMMAATNEIDAEDIEGVDSVSDLTGGINELIAASEQINDGTHQLADGAKQLDDGIGKYTDGVAQANDGSKQLAAGTKQLKEGIAPLGSVQGKIDELANGATQLYEGSAQLQTGLKQYTDGVASANTGAQQLAAGTAQLKEGMAPLASAYPQIDQLIDGADQLNAGSAQLEAGLKQYTAGVSKLNEGNKQLDGITKGFNSIKQGSTVLVKGTDSVNQGLIEMQEQMNGLDPKKIAALNDEITKAKEGLSHLQDIVTKDQATLGTMADGLNNAQNALKNAALVVEDINGQTQAMNAIIQSNNEKITKYNDSNNTAAQSFANTKAEYIKQIDSAIVALQANQIDQKYEVPVTTTNEDGTTTTTNETRTVKVDFSSQIAALESQKDTLANAQSPADLETLTELDPTQLNNDFEALKTGLSTLNTALTNSTTALSQMQEDIKTSNAILDSMSASLTDPSLGANLKDLNDAMDQLKKGLGELQNGAKSVSTGTLALDSGLDKLQTESEAAFKQLQQGSEQLAAQNDTLNAGAEKLAQGTAALAGQKDNLNALKDGLAQLSTGVDQLNSGADQLAQGTSQLDANSAALNDGIAQLSAGTKVLYDQRDSLGMLKAGLGQLSTGVDQLNDGSAQLSDGLNELDANSGQLRSGSSELLAGAEKLRDGSDQFQQQGMGQLKEKLDLTTNEVNTLFDIVNAIQELNKENSSFAGAPEGADTTVRYVFRTEEDTDEE